MWPGCGPVLQFGTSPGDQNQYGLEEAQLSCHHCSANGINRPGASPSPQRTLRRSTRQRCAVAPVVGAGLSSQTRRPAPQALALARTQPVAGAAQPVVKSARRPSPADRPGPAVAAQPHFAARTSAVGGGSQRPLSRQLRRWWPRRPPHGLAVLVAFVETYDPPMIDLLRHPLRLERRRNLVLTPRLQPGPRCRPAPLPQHHVGCARTSPPGRWHPTWPAGSSSPTGSRSAAAPRCCCRRASPQSC